MPLYFVGTPWLVRKVISKVWPTTQITQNDNTEFCISVKTPVFTREEKFCVGKEFEVPQMDGSKSKVGTAACSIPHHL